jgi:cytochrome c biogenesis protein
MTDLKTKTQQAPKKPGVIISFLGSMNLAVTLLVMLAIASVSGTILKQDESLQAYIIKFGPFWADVFHTLGLYHVYGAAWFILVLLFLLLSTGTCLSRNTVPFLREVKQYSEKMSITAYQHQPYHVELDGEHFDKAKAQTFLEEEGYKTKIHESDEQITVAGIKGRWNRLGYIFTHSAIIVICIGALLDSNLLLKYRELTGHLKPETRSVPLSQIPKVSWLSPHNFSFRGTVNIPEGQQTNVLFLP